MYDVQKFEAAIGKAEGGRDDRVVDSAWSNALRRCVETSEYGVSQGKK